MLPSKQARCHWANSSELMMKYHDEEWGRPVKTDLALFSKLMLDCQQAGLSWAIILNKREAFLELYDGFDPSKVAVYDAKKVEEILSNPRIVRNRLKVNAMITNAKLFLKYFNQANSFTNFIWSHTNFKTIDHQQQSNEPYYTKTDVSDKISSELKKMGFKFVGSTVIYAFLQAVGVYNDHLIDCPCHQ